MAKKVVAFRRLRGYAFDPSLSLRLDTVEVNNITFKLEWEPLDKHPTKKDVSIPRGEYVEIIDYDPATGVFYKPVDLDKLELLLQDGLTPNVNNPEFHQQMVYAVVMLTIKNFEKALGRKIQWAEHIGYTGTTPSGKPKYSYQFVQRLRIYPHALRQANAFYHPDKKALLFGYFPAAPASPGLQLPGSTVFTCLSHDVIAHETTHAILDGLHRRYIEPTHPDTRAFHEAFADLVALFQHFTFPEVLKHQIAQTRGDLLAQNLLGQLAQEFGKAMGNYGSLRDAIGHYDKEKKEWVPHAGDPAEYQTVMEFHGRGAILVAAIFDAFLNIYKRKIRSLLRIATGGSGILPAGELHPDLVDKLADTAAKTAGQLLTICVRALDYCPPVDITFGDYLRAIITADRDMVADDEMDYRIAFIEAFQKRGIFPRGLKSMSVETLCFPEYPGTGEPKMEQIFVEFLRKFKNSISYEADRETIYNTTKAYIAGSDEAKMGLHQRINSKFIQGREGKRFAQLTGLLFPETAEESTGLGLGFSVRREVASFQVGNLWLASRATPDGKIVNHVVLTLLQRRGVVAEVGKDGVFRIIRYFVPDEEPIPEGGFIFRGGCTLIFDLDVNTAIREKEGKKDKSRTPARREAANAAGEPGFEPCLKYAVRKSITDEARMEQQYRYAHGLLEGDEPAGMTYFDEQELSALAGPFAFMHGFHQH